MQELKGFNTNEFYSRFFVETALDKHVDHVDQKLLQELMGMGQSFFSRFHNIHNATPSLELMEHRDWFHGELLTKLGFSNLEAEFHQTDKRKGIPIRGKIPLIDKEELWIIEGSFGATTRDISPLDDIPSCNFLNVFGDKHNLEIDKSRPFSKLFDEILTSGSACSWIIFLAGERMYLLERDKWLSKATYVEVEWDEVFGNKDRKVFKAIMGLFGSGAFKVENGEIAHNLLAETAHREAHGVTKSLKFAVRDALELLMNEVLNYHRSNPDAKVIEKLESKFTQDEIAKELSSQGLRYLYRLLFLFFVESRGQESEILPVKSKGYSLGYSLENLRNLELKKITGGGTGNYIQQTLSKTFDIMFFGVEFKQEEGQIDELYCAGFECPQIGTMLFDKSKTPIITSAHLKDTVMQKVIAKLSLSECGKGQNSKVSRISYANLGLNQLGAVYEGLLDLKPVIVQEDCYTVKLNDSEFLISVKDKAKFDATDFQIDTLTGKIVLHEKGDFVFSTKGYERKYSASFYTDESLTKCLVRECLEEYFKNDKSKPACEKIENMKILEPAMGSGAFLNEVASQLSSYYADAMIREGRDKEIVKEINLTLVPEKQLEYAPKKELLDRAKEYIMRNCLYGVDLNPMATELAKVSLWLNCVHKNGRFTFHDFKIRCGNSLVGASVLKRSKTNEDAPHFLLPLPEMIDTYLSTCELGDKERSFLSDEQIEYLKKVKGTFQQTSKLDNRLKKISNQVHSLYKKHSAKREKFREIIQDTKKTSSEIEREYLVFIENSTEYKAIRLVMDYWCSLWLWKPEHINDFPNMEDYLTDIEQIIQSTTNFKRSKIVAAIVEQVPFFHYDLEFPEVFEKGGFDLVLGNPPWAQLAWSDYDFFSDTFLEIQNKKIEVKDQHMVFSKFLSNDKLKSKYQYGVIKIEGIRNYLANSDCYPLADKSKTNTYKYFWQRSRILCKAGGIYGLIKQGGITSDDGTDALRPTYLKELTSLYRFINEKKLFEADHKVPFVMGVFTKGKSDVRFNLIDSLFHPVTIDRCRKASAYDEYPNVKDDIGNFNLAGHPDRIVTFTIEHLEKLAKLENLSRENCLKVSIPNVYGKAEWEVLSKATESTIFVNGHGQEFDWTQMYNETNAPKKKQITLWNRQHKKISNAVLSRPNIFVCNPYFKEPDSKIKKDNGNVRIDLSLIEDDYFPATKWKANETAMPGLNNGDNYRLVCVEYAGSVTGKRTLTPALMPPGVTHVNSLTSIFWNSQRETLNLVGLSSSLIYDFLARNFTNGHITRAFWQKTPYLSHTEIDNHLILRVLRLNCISSHYEALWNSEFKKEMKESVSLDFFSPTLPNKQLTLKWKRDHALREEHEREQALCEIDVLVSFLMGISCTELVRIYRTQFGVLQIDLKDLKGQSEPDSFPRARVMEGSYKMFLEYFGVTEEQVVNGYFQKKTLKTKKAA
jgi:hypothetical protein